jgi:isopentenyldiphosphate isomerase
MADLIDVLSAAGLRTGEVLPRAEIHRLGKYHRAVHLYILNSKNEVLIQRRALGLDHAEGVWTMSMTAHIDAGEFSSETVRREVEEGLGIPAAGLKIDFLFSYYQEAVVNETYIDRQFNDVYITRAEVQAERLVFNRKEVSEVKFIPFAHFYEMVVNGTGELAHLTPYYTNECRDLVYFLSDLITK